MDILIVDDEHLARQRLQRLLAEMDGVRVLGDADSMESCLQQVQALDPDLVLLDVRMPGGDGLDTARALGELEDPPAVIFCTAFDEHAIDAFDTQAVGYLLKPIKREQLASAIQKAKKLNKLHRASLVEAQAPKRSHISAKSRRGVELIAVDDVRVLQADQKYVTVFHTDGETLIDDPLKEMESVLGSGFVRVHRNALVSLAHVESMVRSPAGHYELNIQGVDVRPVVSRRHVTQLRELLTHL